MCSLNAGNTNFVSPSSSENENGHKGNGYARISFINNVYFEDPQKMSISTFLSVFIFGLQENKINSQLYNNLY